MLSLFLLFLRMTHKCRTCMVKSSRNAEHYMALHEPGPESVRAATRCKALSLLRESMHYKRPVAAHNKSVFQSHAGQNIPKPLG